MQEQTRIYTLENMDAIVALLKEKMATAHVFTFTGVLGAGKTTLILHPPLLQLMNGVIFM